MDLISIPALVISLFSTEMETANISIRTEQVAYRWQVEIADGPFSQIRGLMGRQSLAQDRGMLFLYDSDRRVQFWMKDVAFPLDMLFADRCGVILHIHEDAKPGSETLIDPGLEVRMVLEVPGGASKSAQIRPGHQIDMTSVLAATPLQRDPAAETPLPCFY